MKLSLLNEQPKKIRFLLKRFQGKPTNNHEVVPNGTLPLTTKFRYLKKIRNLVYGGRKCIMQHPLRVLDGRRWVVARPRWVWQVADGPETFTLIFLIFAGNSVRS